MRAEEKRSVVFVGTERGMESRLVPEAGFPLETIRVAGLKGIGGMKLVRNVGDAARGVVGLGRDSSPASVWRGARRGRLRRGADDACSR